MGTATSSELLARFGAAASCGKDAEAWIASASLLLENLAVEDGGESPWTQARALFPDFHVCSLQETDWSVLFRVLDQWNVPFDRIPSPFLDLLTTAHLHTPSRVPAVRAQLHAAQEDFPAAAPLLAILHALVLDPPAPRRQLPASMHATPVVPSRAAPQKWFYELVKVLSYALAPPAEKAVLWRYAARCCALLLQPDCEEREEEEEAGTQVVSEALVRRSAQMILQHATTTHADTLLSLLWSAEYPAFIWFLSKEDLSERMESYTPDLLQTLRDKLAREGVDAFAPPPTPPN